MTQNAIVTDLNLCVGCLACAVACKAVNNVPVGNFWNKVLRIGPNKAADENAMPEMYFLPVTCQHCKDPACVQVCPTEASYKAEDGTVQVNKEKCIGCQYCMYACPYGVRQFNEDEGVVEKCTLCNHLTAHSDGVENPNDSFDPDHAVPPCVHNCCCGARFYGDLDDPNSAASRAIAAAGGEDSENVHTITDKSGAKPTCRYILSPSIATWKEL